MDMIRQHGCLDEFFAHKRHVLNSHVLAHMTINCANCALYDEICHDKTCFVVWEQQNYKSVNIHLYSIGNNVKHI